MITKDLVEQLNHLRQSFIKSFDILEESTSFSMVLKSNKQTKSYFDHLKTGIPKKLKEPFQEKFVAAIVGSSGHGKTTIVDEIFPDLSKRKWLVTDVTDTTSQSLRIEYSPNNAKESDEIALHSWDIAQIKELLNSPEVRTENEKDNIHIVYREDSIEIDGSQATFSKKDLRNFKYPLKQTLKPFNQKYYLPENKKNDPDFIRALTIKEQSSKLETNTILTIDGEAYNPLQLRAIVKDVTLKDSFKEIQNWGNFSEEELQNFVFVDTPGLAVSGSIKDEILKHPLEQKSNQIVLELLKNDELDLIIHLVLCGGQSEFSVLWKALEKECGMIGMEDLSERLILVINGTNILFNNRDLKKHINSGDHFDVILEDNILQKMSPRGKISPAKICFVDSKKVVENSGFFSSQNYEETYQKYFPEMERWTTPGEIPYNTLKRLKLVEDFKENLKALCDPEDRGQGYLIRQMAEVIRTKGSLLLLKKFLLRTELINRCEKILELLLKFYNTDGELNSHATQKAIESCFEFLDKNKTEEIEFFCVNEVDPELESIIEECLSKEDWILKSFEKSSKKLLSLVIAKSKPRLDKELANVFMNYYKMRVTEWGKVWGYENSKLSHPENTNNRTKDLLLYSLKTHMREILFQFLTNQELLGELQSFNQDEEDKKIIQNLIQDLKDALKEANQLCDKYGVRR